MDAADLLSFHRPRPARRVSGARRPSPRIGRAGVRWDRVGRVALLVVLVGIIGLYVGPLHSLWTTWHQARSYQGQVTRLQNENRQLRARAAALHRPQTLEVDARKLGMVRPGELPYVISGLPPGN
ncbi:MAG: FtsB family cell division protein [Solirubrobacteraceae bacterium]|nr:MAG: hypothetical protein DLM63_02680 [Solirubrobacterales bacterium]